MTGTGLRSTPRSPRPAWTGTGTSTCTAACWASPGARSASGTSARATTPQFLDRPDADEAIAALHAAKTRRYVEYVEAGRIGLRPGVARLVAEARAAGTRLAIATTTNPDNVTALLEADLGPQAPGWFEVIGAGDVVPRKKPAPDIYRWVVDRLGLAPEDCLAIEDSAVGLHAATAAGLPTVVTRSPYTAHDDARGALAVLADLADTTLADLTDLHSRVAAGQS